ncbi:MAG: heavy metal translocating P-type ATPase [Cellvibrionaceae bacterium]
MQPHSCFQCGLPVPASQSLSQSLSINGEMKYFCCLGCKTVAQLIDESGLVDFYQFRPEELSAKTADIVAPENAIDFSFYDDEDVCKEFVSDIGDGMRQARLYIEGIHCTACTWLIEQFMGQLPDVVRVNVNSVTHTCLIEYKKTATLSDILNKFIELGYQPKPSVIGQSQRSSEEENKTALLRLAVAGFAMVQVGMFAVALYAGALSDMTDQWQSLFRWVSLFVAIPVVFFSAVPFFVGARRAVLSRHLTMDVPVALAIALAFSASCWATFTNSGDVYFDSVSMFTFFLLSGRYLEMRVRHKNEQGINQLVYLLPPHVLRISFFADSVVRKSIPLNQVLVGDVIVVREGEVIPVDGVIMSPSKEIEGNEIEDNERKNTDGIKNDIRNKNNFQSSNSQEFFVNESMLTGEAKPIKKNVGDLVMAGTINHHAEMILKVAAVGSQTRLSAIQGLMSDALHQKPKQVSSADIISGYFVSFVLILSVFVATCWYFIDPSRAFWITLSVLVVTCPCALSLATPVSITAAIYRLRQIGLLVTKPHVIESLDHISHVVFDKTGTLTTGNMRIQDIVYPNDDVLDVEERKTRELNSLLIAAKLEEGSSHPLAKVFSSTYEKILLRQPIENRIDIKQRRTVIGYGIEGYIDGECYRIGKFDFVSELFASQDKKIIHEKEGVTLGNANGVIAIFNIKDSIRPEAKTEISKLKRRPLHVELLSGDNEKSVTNVATELAIVDYRSNMSPEDKLTHLKQYQNKNAKVLMIGDGLNDLPVLSGADVSIAMSSATDLAQVQADSVLLRDDLSILSQVLDCVRLCQKIIRQNLTWAIIYNVMALPLAALGYIPPYAAAIGMSLSSLIVVLNATRIYGFKES